MIERISRGKAIRAKCIDCCCGQKNEVRLCPAKDCPLWPYRLGKEDLSEYDPQIIRELEQKREKQGCNTTFPAENENYDD